MTQKIKNFIHALHPPKTESKNNWGIIDNNVNHSQFGNVDIKEIVGFDEYELLAVVPLTRDYAFLLLIVKIKGLNYLLMKDLRVDIEKNLVVSVSEFRFFISRKKFKRLRDEIKSCKREDGVIGLAFLLRRLSSLKINNICTSDYIKA